MAATVTVRWVENDAVKVGGLADLAAARASGSALWVDVLAPDEATVRDLATHFEIHPLAIEDMLHFPQRPKIDTYPGAIFIVWATPHLGDDRTLTASEIDILLATDHIITSHDARIPAIDDLIADPCGDLTRGPEWILHAIVDRSVDGMFPIVDMVGEDLDRIEDELLADVRDHQLQELYAIKRVMLNLHKIIGPERDVLRSLARHEEFVSQEAYLFLQDVGDHVARISDAVDTYRDVASSVMDIYLSAISNRLNVVMKQLTVVATIFMPLTLITGIYGMNLTKGMWPGPDSPWSFLMVIGGCVVISIGMLGLFKRRGWW